MTGTLPTPGAINGTATPLFSPIFCCIS
jgi:hypothetical protein